MKRRVFLGLGAASIGAGALHSTGAFSSLSAGRGVAVSAADDSSALLKIEDRDTEEPEFTNQTDVTMEITFEPEDDSVTFDGQDADTFALELDPGSDQTVNLDTSGITPIEVTATLRNDSDESIGSIELKRGFGVPKASNLSEVVGESDNAGAQFRFTLINEGDDNVSINGIKIVSVNEDEGQPDAKQVGGRNQDDILERRDTNPNRSIVDEIIEVAGDLIDFTGNVELETNNEDGIEFRFDRFRDDDNDGVQVVGVEIEVRAVEDGSTEKIKIGDI